MTEDQKAAALSRLKRIKNLSILEGVYRFNGAHYPEVQKALDANPNVFGPQVQNWQFEGRTVRQGIGLPDAETRYIVIPYRYWTAS